MRRLLVILLLQGALLTACAQAVKVRVIPRRSPSVDLTPYGQRVFLVPGDSSSRQFGDLVLWYRLARSGTNIQCTLYLATQLVGIRQLSAATPTCDFDLQLGYGKACGSLALQLVSGPQGPISTLAGNFSYSASRETFVFKGDLIGWRVPR